MIFYMNNFNTNWHTRISLVFPVSLATFGILRFISDMLTDASSNWYQMIERTFLRYLVRAPSDDTFWDGLSVQGVKFLAVPCGISVLFVLYRLLSYNLKKADYRWHQTSTRILYIIGFLVMVTVMKIEKAPIYSGCVWPGS